MKKLIVLLLPLGMLLTHCKEEQLQSYNENPAVYFANFSENDSLLHSLAGTSGISDTVYITIKLLGATLNTDRQFNIQVDPTYTTAQAGQHYELLKESYTFPAHQFSLDIPIILYNTDPELERNSFKLGLSLLQTDEMNIGYPNRSKARIIFTNQLIKPSYWDTYLKNYYGDYSKVKHQKCIEIQKFDFPATREEIDNHLQARFMSYGRLVCKYFIENDVYDENSNKILPWSPL